tara:strand:+ start:16703 stop:17299 length:597 start_codon:yes stop_codon:yes gene_type:complete
MNSETSTDRSSFRPWHLFVLLGLLASTVAVVLVQPGDPVVLVLLVAAIGSASGVGFALCRTLWPLVGIHAEDQVKVIGGRTRAAIEREKTLVLRSIKELEFDRAMGKVSKPDFDVMKVRLRSQALALIKKLDADMPGYREAIEQELVTRLADNSQNDGLSRERVVQQDFLTCESCGTVNDIDSKFCKHCASPVNGNTE